MNSTPANFASPTVKRIEAFTRIQLSDNACIVGNIELIDACNSEKPACPVITT